jgi:hypothetical protein
MRFDLSKYSTVAERLAKFHQDYPDGRIITEWANEFAEQGEKARWVIKTTIYLSAGDQANNLPKATGYAFEIDGTGGANQTSALENAESSSIGRCLMVMGYSMNKEPNSLASREEMQKVVRAQKDFIAEADKLSDKEQLRLLWAEAKASGASSDILDRIQSRATSSTSSVSGGAQGSVPKLFDDDAEGKGTGAVRDRAIRKEGK